MYHETPFVEVHENTYYNLLIAFIMTLYAKHNDGITWHDDDLAISAARRVA